MKVFTMTEIHMDEQERLMFKDVIENVLNCIESGAYKSSFGINEVQNFCLTLLEEVTNE